MRTTFLFFLAYAFSWGQTPLERLENSPRHHEWVNFSVNNTTVQNFLVYPEVSENVPVVIVIHENRGLNDWARSMADQIAEMGYIAIAPDFLSGTAPNGGGTADYENPDEARTGIYNLTPEYIKALLDTAVDYSKAIPSGNGKVAVIGFCWGGSQSFSFATHSSAIETAIVCYGTGPSAPEAYNSVEVPVYGFYGGNDNRVNATIPTSETAMKNAGKFFEPVVYDGAGHGFFRAGEEENASPANQNAREKGLARLRTILSSL